MKKTLTAKQEEYIVRTPLPVWAVAKNMDLTEEQVTEVRRSGRPLRKSSK